MVRAAIVLLILVLLPPAAHAQKRVALVIGNASEAFRDHGVFGSSPKTLVGPEMGRFDHQRVALPTTDGISHPFSDVLRRMRTVDANDARVVHHLDVKNYVPGRLDDLVGAVIHGR